MSLVTALAVASSALATRWVPVTLRKEKGAVSATLTYEKDADESAYPPYRNMKLTVYRAGKAVFTEPLCGEGSCEPSPLGALDVRNVWGDGQAEVLAELYTGGAHCCFGTEVVIERDGTWRSIPHDWGDLGYRGQWHGGAYYFIPGTTGSRTPSPTTPTRRSRWPSGRSTVPATSST